MNAEFSTAQAVTPGQGQTVRVSGVQIGEIGGVTLKNGIAIVQMQIDQKYKHLIHTDATALLRPRTGLKDMFIELNPGTKQRPIAKPGLHDPGLEHAARTSTSTRSSPRSTPTPAQYLDLLVNGAGQGLKGNGGNELAQVLERFEPTHRDLARLNKAVAVRGREPAPAGQLAAAAEHGARGQAEPDRLSWSTRARRVFRAFASEDQNVSRAVADLPATLQQTTVDARQGAGVRERARAGGDATCSRRRRRCPPPTRR